MKFLRGLGLLAAALALPCCTGDVGKGDSVTVATVRVSVGELGEEANGECFPMSLSGDGRYVAFGSQATNLTPNDANAMADVLVKDRQTGHLENITNIAENPAVLSAGEAGSPQISADGRYVAFLGAGNYQDYGVNWTGGQIYRPVLYDRVLRRFTAVHSPGQYFNDQTYYMALSPDARYLVFACQATNTGFTVTGNLQIYLCDFGPNRDQTTLTLVSRSASSATTGCNGSCRVLQQAISADGEIVVFDSPATNLSASDADPASDVFLWRRSTGSVTLVSLPSSSTRRSNAPSVSPDGTTIGYVIADDALLPQPSHNSWQLYAIATGQRSPFSSLSETASPSACILFSGDGSTILYGLEEGPRITARLRVPGGGTLVPLQSTTGDLPTVSVFYYGLSQDGRWAGWATQGSNQVSDDTNGFTDVFVRGPF